MGGARLPAGESAPSAAAAGAGAGATGAPSRRRPGGGGHCVSSLSRSVGGRWLRGVLHGAAREVTTVRAECSETGAEE